MTSRGGLGPGILFVPGIMALGLGSMYRTLTRRPPPPTVGGAFYKAYRQGARPFQWIGALLLAAGAVWLLVDAIS